eukprot:CAMPEP_0113472948 /NCGR_PEP_ID=MMETSP0014_2-20120614/17786_1 /TAXON_ID=2857 /ORGANISM="Nitzschia sp." /LENGTH=801 /DNA_ID=CAMNT_0000365689 /DNA_START=279 /DNA_END=2684 /DNA_ORIENTATION=- /assembly_acc=CAM_ASM_000159
MKFFSSSATTTSTTALVAGLSLFLAAASTTPAGAADYNNNKSSSSSSLRKSSSSNNHNNLRSLLGEWSWEYDPTPYPVPSPTTYNKPPTKAPPTPKPPTTYPTPGRVTKPPFQHPDYQPPTPTTTDGGGYYPPTPPPAPTPYPKFVPPTPYPTKKPTPVTTAPTSNPTAAPTPCVTITEIACTTPGFEILCDLLLFTDLDLVLSDHEGKVFTVFAPTNDAFDKIGEDVLTNLTKAEISDILLYHVVLDQELFKDDLVCDSELEMANGFLTETQCELARDPERPFDKKLFTTRYFQVGTGNMEPNLPEIVEFDIDACNGVIQVIDEVMLFLPRTDPPTGAPSATPTSKPSSIPSDTPSSIPSDTPSDFPTPMPSGAPSVSEEPSEFPTLSEEPSEFPTLSAEPSEVPTFSQEPSESFEPSESPSESSEPSASPTFTPQPTISPEPTSSPTESPSSNPTGTPSASPSGKPSASPSASPSSKPSASPSASPSSTPSASPSVSAAPSFEPSISSSPTDDVNGRVDVIAVVVAKPDESEENTETTPQLPATEKPLAVQEREDELDEIFNLNRPSSLVMEEGPQPNLIRVELLGHSSFEVEENWGPFNGLNSMIKLVQDQPSKAYTGTGSVMMKNVQNLENPPALTYQLESVQDYDLIRVDFRYLPSSPTQGDGLELDYRQGIEWSSPVKKWIQDYSIEEDDVTSPESYNRVVDKFTVVSNDPQPSYKMATALVRVTPEMKSKMTLRLKMISPTDNSFTLHLDDVAVYGVPKPTNGIVDNNQLLDTSSVNYEWLVFPSAFTVNDQKK